MLAEMGVSSSAVARVGTAVDAGGREATVLRVKVKLVGVSRPPVWRRLLVPASFRLDRFHDILQAAMGWENYHMHVFSNGSAEFGLPHPELGFRDERTLRLDQVVKDAGDRLRYTYDFGDDWQHDVVVEEVLVADPDGFYPVCVAGKGACPPEDCGGRWGYEQLREVLADPAHEEHEEMLDWLGLEAATEFDPARLDLDEVNEELALSGAGRR